MLMTKKRNTGSMGHWAPFSINPKKVMRNGTKMLGLRIKDYSNLYPDFTDQKIEALVEKFMALETIPINPSPINSGYIGKISPIEFIGERTPAPIEEPIKTDPVYFNLDDEYLSQAGKNQVLKFYYKTTKLDLPVLRFLINLPDIAWHNKYMRAPKNEQVSIMRQKEDYYNGLTLKIYTIISKYGQSPFTVKEFFNLGDKLKEQARKEGIKKSEKTKEKKENNDKVINKECYEQRSFESSDPNFKKYIELTKLEKLEGLDRLIQLEQLEKMRPEKKQNDYTQKKQRQAIKADKKRRALDMLKMGMFPDNISNKLNVTRRTVHYWRDDYIKQGKLSPA